MGGFEELSLAAQLLCELGPLPDIDRANEIMEQAIDFEPYHDEVGGDMVMVSFPDGSSCGLPKRYFGE